MLGIARVQLERMLHKYRELARLRAAHAAGSPPPDKAFFVGFAAEFPGALRELDRLPPHALEARLRELEHQLCREPERAVFIDNEPWLVVSLSYHATLAAPGRWPSDYVAVIAPLARSGGGRRRVTAAFTAIAAQQRLRPEEVRALLFPW